MMKKIAILTVAFAALSIFIAGELFAQPMGFRWRGPGGWGPGAPYNKMYDPKTVETISGEVVKVDRITPLKGMVYGVYISVKTDKEEIPVQLGPGWYLEYQDVKIEPKDKVEVKGSRITFFGKPAIFASEVKKGDQVLKLRDDNGFPLWSGWRRW